MPTARELDLDLDSSEYALVYAWEHAYWGVHHVMNELTGALGTEREINDELLHELLAELEDRSARSWSAFSEYLDRSGISEVSPDREQPDREQPDWEIPMPGDFGGLTLVDPSAEEED